jgi:hypothetical protein
MGQTKTNNFALAYAIESAVPGVLPGSPLWKQLEPNNIPAYGSTNTTSSRAPISKRRQRRKGKLVDQSASVELEMDMCLDPLEDFAMGFLVANWQGSAPQAVTACDTNSFTTLDNNISYAVGTLVHVRGMRSPQNNGLKVVTGTPTDTDVPVVGTLVAEVTAPTNAVIERAGIRCAAGDLGVNADGNLISTTLDFTTLGLIPGQTIWVGGEAAANQFFSQANADTNYGYARVTAIAANLLTLDQTASTFVVDDGTSTGSGGTARSIDLFFGRFLRNVDVDDPNYRETTFHFEGAFANLETGGATGYEYAIGQYPNEATFTIPETEECTMNFAFVGIDTQKITTTRKAGASTALAPVRTDSFSSSSDLARLRLANVDGEGLTTCFKSMTVTLQNNVEPEKCLGVLGSPFINFGNFFVNIEATVMFTNKNVIDAIKDNETCSLQFALDNDDGAIFIDLPALTLGGGGREFPANKSITASLTGETFGDSVFGASLMMSLFPFVPTI